MKYNNLLILFSFIFISIIGITFGISSLYFYTIYTIVPLFLVLYFIIQSLCKQILILLSLVVFSWCIIIIVTLTISSVNSVVFALNSGISLILVFISAFAYEIDSKCKCMILSKKNHAFCSLLFLILILSLFYIFIFVEGIYFGYTEMANRFLPSFLSLGMK